PRIIGGSPASNSAFSFTGKMLARDPKYAGTTCTGTLITPSIVITTADCLITSGNTWYNSNLVTVSFGSTLQDVYTARQLMISDQYNSNTKHYNFGLIFLAQSVPSSVATPARVYMGQPAANTPVIAAGYGMTANTNGTYPSQLITVGLTLSSQSFCASKNSYFDSNSQICTDGGSGKDTCPGDAGGPLLVPVDSSTYALLGVTSVSTIPKGSSNPYCGLPGSVGYYERIGFWVQWMVKNANLTSSDI
ncbi:trypsin-like serine protease, partial [Martensiomyces pterosporus]